METEASDPNPNLVSPTFSTSSGIVLGRERKRTNQTPKISYTNLLRRGRSWCVAGSWAKKSNRGKREYERTQIKLKLKALNLKEGLLVFFPKKERETWSKVRELLLGLAPGRGISIIRMKGGREGRKNKNNY